MERVIKFRAWVGQMEYDITVGRFGAFYVNPGPKGNGLDEQDSASLSPFTTIYSESTPIMQFTGLTDKNGKEIYEADRLRDEGGDIGTVEFDAGHFIIRHENGTSDFIAERNKFEIVGNKYEG